jgi:hypothetical protein
MKKGKGFLGDLGNIAKTGALSVAQQGMDAGKNHLNDKINNIGGALKTRVVGRRKGVNKKKTKGGALYPAGYTP